MTSGGGAAAQQQNTNSSLQAKRAGLTLRLATCDELTRVTLSVKAAVVMREQAQPASLDAAYMQQYCVLKHLQHALDRCPTEQRRNFHLVNMDACHRFQPISILLASAAATAGRQGVQCGLHPSQSRSWQCTLGAPRVV
jgi:hypothetical protein